MKYLLLGVLFMIGFFFISAIQMVAWIWVIKKEISKYLEGFLHAQSEQLKQSETNKN